jgi:hypothetical protein
VWKNLAFSSVGFSLPVASHDRACQPTFQGKSIRGLSSERAVATYESRSSRQPRPVQKRCVRTGRISSAELHGTCDRYSPPPNHRATRQASFPSFLALRIDGGGHRWAVVCSLADTCKLCGVELNEQLSQMLRRETADLRPDAGQRRHAGADDEERLRCALGCYRVLQARRDAGAGIPGGVSAIKHPH